MKTSASKGSNGVSIPNQQSRTGHPEEGAPQPEAYQMPQQLHQELLGLINNQSQAKVALADKLMELRAIEGMVLQLNQDVGACITGFAKAHGVDPANAEKGRWNFDIPSGTLTKVG